MENYFFIEHKGALKMEYESKFLDYKINNEKGKEMLINESFSDLPPSKLLQHVNLESMLMLFDNNKAIVIKKINEFISFKLGNVQFLDLKNFLGAAISLDSSLKT